MRSSKKSHRKSLSTGSSDFQQSPPPSSAASPPPPSPPAAAPPPPQTRAAAAKAKFHQKRSFSAISLRSLHPDSTLRPAPSAPSTSVSIRHVSSASRLNPTVTMPPPQPQQSSSASLASVSSSSGSLKKLNPISYIRRRRASTDETIDLFSHALSPEDYRGAGSIFGTRTHDWGSDAPTSPIFHPTPVFSAPSHFPTTTDAIKMTFSSSVYSTSSSSSVSASDSSSNAPFSPITPTSSTAPPILSTKSSPTTSLTTETCVPTIVTSSLSSSAATSPPLSGVVSPKLAPPALVATASDLSLVQEEDEEDEEATTNLPTLQNIEYDDNEFSEPVSRSDSTSSSVIHSKLNHTLLPPHHAASSSGLSNYDIANGSSIDINTLKKELSTIIRKSRVYEQSVAAHGASAHDTLSCDEDNDDSIDGSYSQHSSSSAFSSARTPVLTSDVAATPALCISKHSSPAPSSVSSSFALGQGSRHRPTGSAGSAASSLSEANRTTTSNQDELASEGSADRRSIFSFEEDQQMGRNSSINYHKPVNVLDLHQQHDPVSLKHQHQLRLNTAAVATPGDENLSPADSNMETPTQLRGIAAQGLGRAYLDIDDMDSDEYPDESLCEDDYDYEEGSEFIEDDAHLFGDSESNSGLPLNPAKYTTISDLEKTPTQAGRRKHRIRDDEDMTIQLKEGPVLEGNLLRPSINLLTSTPEDPRKENNHVTGSQHQRFLSTASTKSTVSRTSSHSSRSPSPPMPMSQQLLLQQQQHARLLNQQFEQRPLETASASASSSNVSTGATTPLSSPISARGLGAMRYLNHSPLAPLYLNTQLSMQNLSTNQTSPERAGQGTTSTSSSPACSPSLSPNPYFLPNGSSGSLYLSPSRSASVKAAAASTATTSPVATSPYYHNSHLQYNPLHHNHHQTQYFNNPASSSIYTASGGHTRNPSTVSFESVASSKYYSASEGDDEDFPAQQSVYSNSSHAASTTSGFSIDDETSSYYANDAEVDYDSLLDEVNAIPEDYGDSDDEIFHKPIPIAASRFAGPTLEAVPASPPSDPSPLATVSTLSSGMAAIYARRARTRTISSTHAPIIRQPSITSPSPSSLYRGLRKSKSLSFEKSAAEPKRSLPSALNRRQTSVIKNRTTTTTLFAPMARSDVESYYRAIPSAAAAAATMEQDDDDNEDRDDGANSLSKKSSTGSASSTDSKLSTASSLSAASTALSTPDTSSKASSTCASSSATTPASASKPSLFITTATPAECKPAVQIISPEEEEEEEGEDTFFNEESYIDEYQDYDDNEGADGLKDLAAPSIPMRASLTPISERSCDSAEYPAPPPPAATRSELYEAF